MAKVILTEEGEKKLEDELNNLKLVRRREIAAKIKDARGQGDLSENAEYDAAREEQAQIEARIKELEQTLQDVKIIETDTNKSKISLGSQVKLLDMEFQEEVIFMIVGSTESDPSNGKISNESPLGNALIGHKTGDTVDVNSPDGIIKYKVIEII